TVPEVNRGALDVALGHLGVPYTCIGQIAPEADGLTLLENGKPRRFNHKGFDHFYAK
ncbi:thiamine-phosphate kinase, partial [Serratia sp. Se-PFBMAAmG]|nr:thiamine-phosphate kinase [Serratia sp. Se-PFBMAAmG]